MLTEISPLETARTWIERGRSVIPIPHGQKRPVVENWSLLRIGSNEVAEYFNGGPQNIGLLLGEPSGGLIDIDLDTDESVEAARYLLPASATYGRKSRPASHILYICPEARTKQYSHGGAMLVEIRSTGAQSLIPPSIHPSGEQYEYSRDNPKALEIDVNTLQSAVSRVAAAALLASEWQGLLGVRHTVTLALAGALIDSGWDEDDVATFLEAVVRIASDDEVRDRLRAVRDTVERHKDHAETTGWNTLSEHLGEKIVTKLKKWLVLGSDTKAVISITSSEWPEAEPLHREAPPPEPYPVDSLGSVLAPMVRVMMDTIQAPDAVCANAVLAAATLAVQAHADVVIDGRQYPISNFLITVAETGERKTAADREALAPHNKRQQELQMAYQAEMAEFNAEFASWKKSQEEALRSKNNTTRESKKEALLELGLEPNQPPSPILTTEEPTYEGLIKALAVGWPSVGLFSDEGGRFLGGHSMKNDNQLKTAAGLSKIWDGSPITRMRSLDGNMVLYGRRVSLHLMVQPSVGDLLFGNDLLLSQGLLSRCLVAHPASMIGDRPYLQAALRDLPEAQQYYARMTEILEAPLPLAEGTINTLSPRRVAIAPKAKGVWIAFHDHIEQLCKRGQALAPVKGLAAKIPEHALRLAGVLALVEKLHATEIKRHHIEAAIELAQFYTNEALRLFAVLGNEPDLNHAEKLLEWLIQHIEKESRHTRRVYLSEIYQKGPRCVRTKAAAVRLMKLLQTHGWIRVMEGGDNIDGRQRSHVWEVR